MSNIENVTTVTDNAEINVNGSTEAVESTEVVETTTVEEISETPIAETVATETVDEIIEESNLPVPTNAQLPKKKEKNKKLKKREKEEETPIEEDVDFTAFSELALLLNKPLSVIKDECCLFQLRKLMAKMGKIIAMDAVDDLQMEKILVNSSGLNVDELLVSPVHVEQLRKYVRKHKLESQKVGVLIDYPAGENVFKTKMVAINNAKKDGVDSITVVMPLTLLKEDQKKVLLKQLKKIARAFKTDRGIAINASDIDNSQIEFAVKMVEKTKLDFITLMFGATDKVTLVNKMKTVTANKKTKQIKVVGKIDTADAVIELFRAGTDVILTPYADEIGANLIKRFNVKSLKLI